MNNIESFFSGLVTGIAVFAIILYVASNGRLYYIFTEDSYKCGAIKILGKNPNISSFYKSNYDAGANMHGCTNGIYNYNGLQCLIDPSTQKYKCYKINK
jgi:hypothetical protein